MAGFKVITEALPSEPSCERRFLLSCWPSPPPGVKAAGSVCKDIRRRHVLPNRSTGGWRDTDWFNHASRAKLYHGLNCSRVVPVFAVPRQIGRASCRERG